MKKFIQSYSVVSLTEEGLIDSSTIIRIGMGIQLKVKFLKNLLTGTKN